MTPSSIHQLARDCGFELTADGRIQAPESTQDLAPLLQTLAQRILLEAERQAKQAQAHAVVAQELHAWATAMEGSQPAEEARALADLQRAWGDKSP